LDFVEFFVFVVPFRVKMEGMPVNDAWAGNLFDAQGNPDGGTRRSMHHMADHAAVTRPEVKASRASRGEKIATALPVAWWPGVAWRGAAAARAACLGHGR